MGQPSVPASPNPARTYAQEIGVYMAALPGQLAAEQGYRQQYDPQSITEQQGLQSQFGPTQYSQQLSALNQLDPQGQQVRGQLGSSVSGDLASGYNLPQGLQDQLNTQIRAGQAARGNVLGNAPVSAEAAYGAQAAQNLYQQHLDNAGQYLGLATPEAQISQIQPVSADRSMAYVNPNAGFMGQQLGISNYGNQLGQYNAQVAAGNPWQRAIGGAASGAAAGSAAGGWGALIGALAGGTGGYFSSSRKLKENIRELGKTPSGLPLIVFNYIADKTRKFVGTIAEEAEKINPDWVFYTNGYMGVKYGLTDAPFIEL